MTEDQNNKRSKQQHLINSRFRNLRHYRRYFRIKY